MNIDTYEKYTIILGMYQRISRRRRPSDDATADL